MVKIRLSRTGAKNRLSYRLVVTEARNKRNGKNLAVLGFYDPKTKPVTIKFNQALLDDWLKKGAQLTPIVKKLIEQQNSLK
ncbi:MAG: 30S ribosomal protein S16 [Candidatus Shapirobacteria bacterium]|nr:30S ribosomal protein S16 [Candidatus Shapirobacteria bacterium]